MSDVFRTDGALGAATTPPEFANYVLDRIRHESVLIAAGARVVTSGAKTLTIPRITADVPMGWFSELADMSGEQGDADTITLDFKKVGTVITVGQETVGDSDPATLQVLGDNLAKALALEIDKQLFQGDGTGNKPTGFLRGTTVNSTPTAIQIFGDAATPSYASIVGARTLAKATGAKPRVLFVNPTSEGTLAAQTDGMDRPLLTGTADDSAEVIAGQRVFVTPALNSVTGAPVAGTWGVVCDPEQIIVGIRQDLQLAISDQAAFASDGVLVKISARVDVDLNDVSGVCLIGPDVA
jgi:HK97 family phage major capsid protein